MKTIGLMLVEGGKCKRPHAVDPKVFGSEAPLDVGHALRRMGVEGVLVIDVLAAKTGGGSNTDLMETLCSSLPFEVYLGGGLKDSSVASRLLRAGAKALVVGSRGLEHPMWFAEFAEEFPGAVMLALDSRGGQVMVDSRRRPLGKSVEQSVNLFSHLPLAGLMLTSVGPDGSLAPPRTEEIAPLGGKLPFPLFVQADPRSPEEAAELARQGVEALVLGDQLYSGKLAPARLELFV